MAKKQSKLKAEKREIKGRKVQQLRREDILPANIYGKNVDSQAIKLSQIDFEQLYEQIGETSVLNLDIKGEDKERPVLISQVQYHPVSGNPIHVDFRQIDLKEKVIATVPVVLKGEAPAEEKGAVIVKLIDQLDVQALPTDLPDKLELDISSLEEIGDSLSTEDFDIDREKISLQIEKEMEAVQAQEPREEEEIAPPPTEEEGEEGEEGEEPQEGEEPEGEEGEEGEEPQEGEKPQKEAEEK